MNKTHKAKMGRPPKPKAEKQARRVGVNLTPDEYRRLSKEAAAAGMSKSAFLVDCWRAKK